jgi:hypothetical protein
MSSPQTKLHCGGSANRGYDPRNALIAQYRLRAREITQNLHPTQLGELFRQLRLEVPLNTQQGYNSGYYRQTARERTSEIEK